jgi:hypothetical protein
VPVRLLNWADSSAGAPAELPVTIGAIAGRPGHEAFAAGRDIRTDPLPLVKRLDRIMTRLRQRVCLGAHTTAGNTRGLSGLAGPVGDFFASR